MGHFLLFFLNMQAFILTNNIFFTTIVVTIIFFYILWHMDVNSDQAIIFIHVLYILLNLGFKFYFSTIVWHTSEWNIPTRLLLHFCFSLFFISSTFNFCAACPWIDFAPKNLIQSTNLVCAAAHWSSALSISLFLMKIWTSIEILRCL